jgi:hypothetical protein
MDFLAQFGIVVFGCSAVWLVGRKDKKISRWGYVAGLLSEPFWLYTAVSNDQWGIVVLAVWYTYAWGSGFLNHFYDDV